MGSNRFVSWTAFSMFVFAVVLAIAAVFAPTLSQLGLPMSEAIIWVIGVFALLALILGLVSFKTPQGKVAAIGGAIFILAALFITPFFTIAG